ncbi:dipeptide epimerase [Alkalihalobacillus sp. MEB130]|uniref:dipeptide epimerase n=1 Tax=Alkalihalobacillus sp. MEB130 TaxID=2976704 RepID=UPI0028DD718E|nr:dipeptide epimerase [Alkalihalobacillus sp. MEB130]MDT8861885.1 dipeptide epimerase [Alkalihalobacillus sp. MEB130]
MFITDIQTSHQTVLLKKPFKTALRTTDHAQAVIVQVFASNGMIGLGEAVPTLAITGENVEGIEATILQIIKPALLGRNILNYESIFHLLHKTSVRNTSAKAAVDMAIYDLLAQFHHLPLYQFLGGEAPEGDELQIETDYTVSVNSPEEMSEDALEYVSEGFRILKVKVGKDDIEKDILRIKGIRDQIGPSVKIRVDANQGWQAKEAIRAITTMEDMGLNLDIVEQPVAAHDISGLKRVTENVLTPIMADEAVFSTLDAFEVLKQRAADFINIKLMKSGGIYKASIINHFAEECGVQCMVGSMIESHLAVTAAAHFAASKRNITRYDFDAPLMLVEKVIEGGITYNSNMITISNEPGLGIRSMKEDRRTVREAHK